MALKKGAPRSSRALERAGLQAKYRESTLIGLQALEENRIKDPVAIKEFRRELRKYYTDARANAQKAIKRIQESDIPFTDEPPKFPKTSELSDSELLRAVAEVNLFLKSPNRKLKERRKAYQELLDDLHKKGMTYLNMEDLKYWDRFRKWLRASNILGKPYASGDILGDIFAQSIEEGKPTSERWKELYDEVAAMMGNKEKPTRRSGRRKPKMDKARAQNMNRRK